MQDNKLPPLFANKKGDNCKKTATPWGKTKENLEMEFGFLKNIFGKKTEEKQEEIQEENQEKEEKKDINLNQILQNELRKTEQINTRFNQKTINLMREKVEKITKQKEISNSEMINFIVAHFLSNENEDKEPIKILSKDKKRYKITFKLSQEEIEYIFSQCIKKGINLEEGCFQILQQNGISKNAKNQIYRLLMSEIHGLSQTNEEIKYIENFIRLKQFSNRINLNSSQQTAEEIKFMNQCIRQITEFLKGI